MKKLLCIMNSTNVGGAETFMMKILRNIDRTKYVIDFCINVFDKCDYDDEITSYGSTIYRIPSKTENFFSFRKQLYKIVREHNYEYVLRITSNAGGFYDLKVAKKAGAKVCAARSSNSSDGNSVKQRIFHIIGKKMWMKYIDIKIAPSKKAAKYTFNSIDGVIILNNGLDLNTFSYNESYRKLVRNQMQIRDDTMLIGHIGRFEEQKNHAFLIDVFDEYHKLNANSLLMLVGVGSLQEQIRKIVLDRGLEDCVLFAGLRDDVFKLLSAMDFMVLPSLYEGMPNVIIEAQASNLPCLLSDTITNEVRMSSLVSFASLKNDLPQKWAKLIVKNEDRFAFNNCLKINGYGIDDVCTSFVKAVFGE